NLAFNTSSSIEATSSPIRLRYNLNNEVLNRNVGKNITISFDAKFDTEKDFTAYIVQLPSDYVVRSTSIKGGTTEWKRFSFTSVIEEEALNTTNAQFTLATTDYGAIRNLKVELGNKPTDWSPAPEDYQTQIDNQGKILTKHETEIEQNKLGLSTKVGYTEMNGTNKTLEKLLTEFSQTADGFNFRIDSNGMIQDLTFDKNAFKLNSNLIEFNDGDVVIKDGKTTIKDAFIHNLASDNAFIKKLASDTAFIDVLNSQHINSNEVTSEVGDNKTTIHGGFFESSGTYRRTWLGNTSTNQIDIRVE